MMLSERGDIFNITVKNPSEWNMSLTDIYLLDGNVSFVAFDDNIIIYLANGVIRKKHWNFPDNSSSVLEVGDVKYIAVDQRHQNIYFYQPFFQIIGMISYTKHHDGFPFRTVLQDVIGLVDITVDFYKGFLFWITNKRNPQIHSSNLLGEYRKDIVYTGMLHPTKITVDVAAERILWLDDMKETLESSNYSGGRRKVLLQSNDLYKGILLLKENIVIIFSDSHIGLFDEQSTSYIKVDVERPIQDIVQKNKVNQDPCIYRHCNEVCSASANETLCRCYDGHSLQLNGRDCVPPQKNTFSGIFTVIGGNICVSDIRSLGMTKTSGLSFQCSEHVQNVCEIEMDASKKYLYYISEDGNVWKLKRNILGSEHSRDLVLASSNVSMNGLSLYRRDSTLFFGEANRIRRYRGTEIRRYKDSFLDIVIEDSEFIQDLTIDSQNNYLFWISVNQNYIQRSNLDGTYRKRLISSLTIRKLSVFSYYKRLLWSACGGIMSSNFDGTDVDVCVTHEGHVTNMCLHKRLLVWIVKKEDNESKLCWLQYGISDESLCVNIPGIISDIFYYDELMEENYEGRCRQYNGGCQHFCLASDGVCACKPGYTLSSDKKSCDKGLLNNRSIVLQDSIMKSLYFVDVDTFKLQTALETEKAVKAIDVDPSSSRVYIGYPEKVVIVKKKNETSTVFLSDINLEHMCVDSSTIILTSRDNDTSSLLQYNITSEIFNTIAVDLRFPGDVLCDLNNGIVLISEKREEYSVRKVSLTDKTTARIKIRRFGSCRLAAYPKDSLFYCSDIDSNTVYDVTFEGKIGYFYSKSKHVIIDIDVDKQFLYGLLTGERFLLQINRNDASSTKILEMSPLYGQLTLISIQKEQQSEVLVEEENVLDNTVTTVIVLPTLFIFVAGGFIALFVICRRKRQQRTAHFSERLQQEDTYQSVHYFPGDISTGAIYPAICEIALADQQEESNYFEEAFIDTRKTNSTTNELVLTDQQEESDNSEEVYFDTRKINSTTKELVLTDQQGISDLSYDYTTDPLTVSRTLSIRVPLPND